MLYCIGKKRLRFNNDSACPQSVTLKKKTLGQCATLGNFTQKVLFLDL